jgi:chromosome partitioning protein
MITAVISSFKGGTAKTSTVLHIGAALAKFHKKRVLLIDFDSQANLSNGLGIGCDCLETMVPVLKGDADIKSVIKQTSIPGLFLIPGNTYLDGVERTSAVMADPYSHERLRKSLRSLDFDYCLIDVPPSLSWLTQSAYFAADFSLLSLTPEPYSILALHRLAKFHAMINEHHPIKLAGILLSLWDPRIATNQVFVEGISEVFPKMLFDTRVRRDVSVSRAILQGKSVFDAFPKSRVVEDYKALTIEFLKKCQQKEHAKELVTTHE